MILLPLIPGSRVPVRLPVILGPLQVPENGDDVKVRFDDLADIVNDPFFLHVPCEKLSRTRWRLPSPVPSNPSYVSQAGPTVATIFVLFWLGNTSRFIHLLVKVFFNMFTHMVFFS